MFFVKIRNGGGQKASFCATLNQFFNFFAKSKIVDIFV